MGLAPGEAEILGSDLEEWFEDTCDILRITTSEDDFGGWGESETPLASGVRCFLEPGAAHSQVQVLMGKLEGVQIFLVSLPRLTDVQVRDHLVVTSQGDMHLRVQAVLAPESLEFERQVIASTEGEHNET